MPARHALSDAQWNLIRPLLPGKPEDGGRPAADNRLFVEAVLWIAKTGAPWRDLPERFGRWNSVWRRFDRWCKAGRWETLSAALGEPHPGRTATGLDDGEGTPARAGVAPAARRGKKDADAPPGPRSQPRGASARSCTPG